MSNERILQQSQNWNNYIDDNLVLDKNTFYNEGFPKYTRRNYNSINFKLILSNGIIIENATVDESCRWRAEGLRWEDVKTRNPIDSIWVVAWKEVE